MELNALLGKSCTAEDVREAFRHAAAEPPLTGVMGVLEEKFASSRIIGESLSSIIDLPLVRVLGENFVSAAAWYDNEMGYATRLAETAMIMAEG